MAGSNRAAADNSEIPLAEYARRDTDEQEREGPMDMPVALAADN